MSNAYRLFGQLPNWPVLDQGAARRAARARSAASPGRRPRSLRAGAVSRTSGTPCPHHTPRGASSSRPSSTTFAPRRSRASLRLPVGRQTAAPADTSRFAPCLLPLQLRSLPPAGPQAPGMAPPNVVQASRADRRLGRQAKPLRDRLRRAWHPRRRPAPWKVDDGRRERSRRNRLVAASG
jgi:hypothetical protein